MFNLKLAFLFALTMAMFSQSSQAFVNSHVIESVISDHASYPEGPIFSGKDLYYAEYAAHRITFWDGKENRLFWQQAGCGPSAIAPYKSGFIIACYDNNTLVFVSSSGKTERVFAQDRNGGMIKGPNDMIEDTYGGIYFTASGIWDVAAPIEGAVYYLSSAGEISQLTKKNIHYANGIEISPDGKKLIVAEHLANRILRFDILAPGILSTSSEIFIDLAKIPSVLGRENPPDIGPQGTFLTSEGFLYVAQHGAGRVLKFDSQGLLLSQIILDHLWTSNVVVVDNHVFIAAVSDYKNDYPGYVIAVDEERTLKAVFDPEQIIDAQANYPEGGFWLEDTYFFTEYAAHTVKFWKKGMASPQVFWQQEACGPAAVILRKPENLWVSCSDAAYIVVLNLQGELLEKIDGKRWGEDFYGVNDFAIDEAGGIYFTVSGPWIENAEANGRIYYFDRNESLNKVAKGLSYPNGIGLVNSGAKLLVNETLKNRVASFEITSPGVTAVDSTTVFADLGKIFGSPHGIKLFGPDGLQVSKNDQIFIAHFGYGQIVRLEPSGQVSMVYKLPSDFKFVTNMSVRGDALYIAASRSDDDTIFPGQIIKMSVH